MSINSDLSFCEITIENAKADVKSVLEEAKKRIGYIPNIYGMMANSSGLLDTYTAGDKSFRSKSLFTNCEKEIIYLTISKENACAYCVAVHSTLADTMSKVPKSITNAIRDSELVEDEKINILVSFTRTMVVSRGQPTNHDIEQFLSVGYSQFHILDIIHAIAVKTMSNYSNHLFQTPVDKVFSEREWTNS